MTMPAFKSYLLILAFCQSAIVRCLYEPYGENVALNKPASQSSTYVEGRFMFNASLGVDGKTSTNFSRDKTCSHTNERQTSAWWTVNLNGLFFIKFIRIYQLINQRFYNRLDGSNMYVQVEDRTWQHIQFNSSWPPEMIDVNVTLHKRISSIKLNNRKLTTSTRDTFISICELEAYEVLACSPYIVRNGKIEVVKLGDSKQNFTYGAQLNVACENGYHISDIRSSRTEAESIIECMGTNTWSRNVTCSVIECGYPTGIPDHSEVIITPGIAGNTTYNATLTIQCNEGYNYSLQSVEPLRCGSNGSWRGSLGNCNVIHCGEFSGVLGNSTVTSKVGLAGNTSYNATVTIKCNAGFRYTHPGMETVRCNKDGKWGSIQGTCKVTHCGYPTGIPDHSEVIITPGIAGNTTYNATLTIQCNEGYNYSLQSVKPLRCDGNGSWRGSLGNCNVIHCGEFSGVPGNSTVTSKVGLAGNTSYNATVTIKCNAGFRYTHPGKDTVRCNKDGKWRSIQGTCEVITCEESIQNAKNGFLIVLIGIKGNISYNTSVSLTCEDGYHLQGRGLVRCNGSGQWEGDLGTCSD